MGSQFSFLSVISCEVDTGLQMELGLYALFCLGVSGNSILILTINYKSILHLFFWVFSEKSMHFSWYDHKTMSDLTECLI